jgi:di/tricarboxylate transporter
VFGRWLLPNRKPPITPVDDPREYTVEMLVEPGSPLVGKTIEEAGLRHLPGMYLMEIDREGHLLPAVAPSERLMANDRLVFVGIVESVVDLQRIPGLKPATNQIFKLDSPRSERKLIEAVVSNACPVLRMSIRDAQFRSRYNAAVIAVARGGQRIRKKVGDIVLEPGDTLLMEAHPSFIQLQRNSRDFYLVSEVEDSTPPRHEKAWISRLILLGMVAVVAFQWLEIVQAALVAALFMVLSGCINGAEAKRSIDWSVLLAMGAGMGIGKAVEKSGAAEVLGEGLKDLIDILPFQDGDAQALVMLAIVYTVTMILTNIITAKAAAMLLFPIAMASARSLNVDIMPFAIAVIIASAASFATPHGYQTNLMVSGPGGYQPRDYLRIGVPLSILIGVITLAIAPFVWEFHPQ